jgi:hypothetical protein
MSAGNLTAGTRIILAIGSFVIYASAVLALHQHELRNIPFVPEREAFAAAVSTILFGAPRGTMYSDLTTRVRDPSTPLKAALRQAVPGEVPAGNCATKRRGARCDHADHRLSGLS